MSDEIIVVTETVVETIEVSQGVVGPQGPTGATGATGAQGPQGDPGLVWQGAWDDVTAYVVDDVVAYQGSSWVAIQDGTNQPPDSSPLYWDLVASKGDTGAQGPQGIQGEQGETGPAGTTDHSALTNLTSGDPHTQYQKESERGQPDGYASLDSSGTVPDAQLPSTIARDTEVATAVSTHAGESDPHTVYQLESQKGQANGYASLGADGLVPQDQLGSGTQDGTRFLRDDGTWADINEGGAVDHADLANLTSGDPHTQYQKESEKGVANGYASLGADGLVPQDQLGTGAQDGTKFLRDDGTWQLPAGTTDHGSLDGLADDDHPQYQLESEKGQANGYASLGSDGIVPTTQLPVSTTPPTAPSQDTYLISGGQVTWQTGLQYLVAAGSGYINGTLVSWAQQTVTLDAADPTNARIDVIGVNSAATAFEVAGTPAANPSEPVVDPDTQLKLALVTVAAGATQPTVSTELVYAEGAGAEWNFTSSGTGWDFASATTPRTGSVCIRGTNLSSSARATGQRDSGTIDPNAYSQLVFYLRFTAQWNSNRYLLLWLAQDGVKRGNALQVRGGNFGLVATNTTDYQAVIVPALQFAIPAGEVINQVVIEDVGGAISFGIDDVSFISATGQSQTTTGLDQAQADARYARRSNNLSDLTSAATARSNIGAMAATTTLDAVPEAVADIGVGNNKITDLAEPTANQDAATKLYVDTTLAEDGLTNPMTTSQDIIVGAVGGDTGNQALASEGADFTASDAVAGNGITGPFDGSDSTYGDLPTGGPRWYVVDLGSAKSIGSYRVLQNPSISTHWANDLVLEYSNNNVDWTEAANIGATADPDTGTVAFGPITAQYWRLYTAAGAAAIGGWYLYALELNGTTTAGTPARLPLGAVGTFLGVSGDSLLEYLTPPGNALTVEEADGTPTGVPDTLKFPNGTLTDNGDGSFTYTPAAGSALVVEEEDGAPTGTPDTLKFPNGTLTDNGDGSFSYEPAEGGGGGTTYIGSMVPLYETTLGSDQASVVIPIPSGYHAIVVMARARSSAAVTTEKLWLRVNADTGANYDWVQWAASNTTSGQVGSVGDVKISLGDIPGNSAAAGAFGQLRAELADVGSTAIEKTVTAQMWVLNAASSNNLWTEVSGGRWRPGSPAAITSLTFLAATGNLKQNSSFAVYGVGGSAGASSLDERDTDLNFIIDGGGAAIATGVKGDLKVDFACTIVGAWLLADQSGSMVVDIWKDTYANFPPTDADSITASAPLTISAATKAEDTSLTGWTTSLSAGDILRFNVDSCSSITRATLVLRVKRTVDASILAAPFVTTAAVTGLTGEKVIPGLAGSADRAGAGPASQVITEEYDTTTEGLTWTPSAPSGHDSHTTVPSHLYARTTDSTERFALRAFSPAGAFDARCHLSCAMEGAVVGAFGLMLANAGNTDRVVVSFNPSDNGSGGNGTGFYVRAYTYTGGTYTQRGTTWAAGSARYLRITRDASNNVSFWFSFDGLIWTLIVTQAFTFTPTQIGYRVAVFASTAGAMVSDWLRAS